MYFTLVMYHLLGYAMYQYRERLGLHPMRLPAAHFADQAREWLRDPGALDAHLQQLAAEGQLDHAVALLAGLIRREPRNLSLHERYDRALRLAGNQETWRRHASEYLGLLLREGQGAPALGFFDQTRRAERAFRPQDAATQVELARAARAYGRTELASALLLEFDQRFPGSAAQTEAYYLAAQLLHEDYGETVEARKLLDYLVRTYPSDPLAIAAKRYLQALPGALER
jgi:tetratricopeptide (TPR) repeat protein